MKKLIILLLALTVVSCDPEEVVNSLDDVGIASSVTAKQSADDVLLEARTDYSSDAQLAGIYGWNVNRNGKVDLLSTSSAFVYIVQSDIKQENEFYVPVYLAGPVKSPINFSTMLSFVNDENAKEKMNGVFGLLAQQGIDPSANYLDSPTALDEVFSISEVNTFYNANPNAKIDMFLVPSKTIDIISGIVNSADWIVHIYTASESKVYWLNSGTGIVTKF
ncbi:MAG: hypothetical protein K8F60_12410 [Melioribacteraceae bacterium]|nr:hypothetical protein [Melioribacteraceae bacterium]